MSTCAADEVDAGVLSGLWHDDPLVRLLARQVRLSGERVAELEGQNARLRAENSRQGAQIKRLQARLEESRRAGKRQAAPFSRGTRKTDARPSGRKPGADYGTKARRRPPPPERVDEHVDVPAGERCEGCGGAVVVEKVVEQLQEEIVPASTRVRCYHIALGRCSDCRRRVRGRHPDQTSDATGAAGVMLGPVAKALAGWLKVGLGVPMAKTAQILQRLGGLTVTPGGLHSALHRVAGDAESTYSALLAALRASGAVAADETGWRINGDNSWLWAYVGDDVTVFDIAAGRGYAHAEAILGGDFAGTLERDGWAPYRKFVAATHQTCLAHLLRRCHDMIGDAHAGQARIPHQLRKILLDALAVRDRHLTGQALKDAVAALQARIDRFCAARPTHEPNRRLVAHVTRERHHLLTFLSRPGVQATNWRAEQAIRPIVCNRKHWGGNKTRQGADTTAVVASLLRTATQQHLDPITMLTEIQQTRRPPADLALGRSP
jgi:transposase